VVRNYSEAEWVVNGRLFNTGVRAWRKGEFPPESGKIHINSGETARYVWAICLSRINAAQNFPIEGCVLLL